MTLCALARCKRSDIDLGAAVLSKAKHARLHLFYPSSNVQLEHKVRRSQEQALKDVAESVTYARSILEDVEFSAEDASRAELPFLVQLCATAIDAGATTINVPDTVNSPSISSNVSVYRSACRLVSKLRSRSVKSLPNFVPKFPAPIV